MPPPAIDRPPYYEAVEQLTGAGWQDVLAAGLDPDDLRVVQRSLSPPADGHYEDIPDDLHQELAQALRQRGIDELYSHQRTALELAMQGNLIVTTGTASGKSLCFNLPVLHTLLSDTRARALYLYPTKALAQDQARKLAELGLPGRRLRHAIYDGDTPQGERKAVRERSNLILSNPDMLNVGILPHHSNWGDFFANLAWVVVDEAHVYRGVFGSHVANLIRRLRRISEAYGTKPRFVLTSATIANPHELAEQLVGEDFQVLTEDGAPHAEREIVIWNPPLLDANTGRRASALAESADLLARLVRRRVRTICFMKSRKAVELIHRFARDQLADVPELADAITPYRGGYTPAQRRDIEKRLADGDLLGVVATDALELGIDIGHLDAAICTTFPGTVASLRQMWGRAGRREKGLAMYVAGEDALDQFFCRHPEEFIGRPVESALLDPHNDAIHLRHLHAAAFELPLTPDDQRFFGPDLEQFGRRLESAGAVRQHGGRYVPRGPDFPAAKISLRSASTDNFSIINSSSGELIGTIEAERAFSTVHPGAIYMHLGQTFQAQTLDLEERNAIVKPFDADFYTQPKKDTETYIEEIVEQRQFGDVKLSYGFVSVTEQVIAYQRKSLNDHEVLSLEALDLPAQNFLTQALWFEPADVLADDFPLDVLQGALHAAEHAQIAVLPLIAMCDRWDIGGLSTAFHYQTGGATIFIYDGHPGGVGITKRGYDMFDRLVGDARRLIGECPCEAGCPSCVQSPKCGNLNDPLHKAGALELLARIKD